MNDFIAVVDLGGQYAHLIARRVRELGVYSEILKPDATTEQYKKAKGIILSGSPASICDETIKFNKEIYDLGLPIFGFCYGHQMFARDLGGSVSKQETKEFGFAKLQINDSCSVFKDLDKEEVVWMSHHDKVGDLPEGFEIIASTDECDTAAIANNEKKFYGFQFHPEVTHTKNGLKMIGNFVFGICGAEKNWDIENYIDEMITKIQTQVGDKNVFILVSGGVDSMVALALLNKALGKDKLYALHVDTGFMRLNEIDEVDKALSELGLSDFHIVDASKEFFEQLAGVTDPEEKRKIIGNLFIDVKDKEANNAGLDNDNWLLAQGTIYPDTIESGGTDHADTIKTHHNRVDVIQKLIEEGKVIEPLDKLYKDEVRELGTKLGLPDHLVWRHPFPGPGLAIRALCSDGINKNDNQYYLDIQAKAEAIVEKLNISEEIKLHILPIKSVGVQGDLRTYRHSVIVSGNLEYDDLSRISVALTNGMNEVNRIIYKVDEVEINGLVLIKSDLNRPRLNLLREIDDIVMQKISTAGVMREIWQFPTIVLPLGEDNKESVVLRPIESIEAMTVNYYRMDKTLRKEIVDSIMSTGKISHVFFDITNKPPGTIEWE